MEYEQYRNNANYGQNSYIFIKTMGYVRMFFTIAKQRKSELS